MKVIFTIYLTAIAFLSFAQGRYDVWYFGKGLGLDFNQNPPLKKTDGALNAEEGTATICDSTGKLLYYTDGVTVWDSNHQILPNGNGLSSSGSSIQAALIIKQPKSQDRYFVFTTSGGYVGIPGLHYSIIDGGKVVQKNKKLLSSPTERLTAFYQQEVDFYWIATTGDDIDNDSSFIYIYKLSVNGVVLHHRYKTGLLGERGQIKFSPNGKMLGIACEILPYVGSINVTGKIVLLDFDDKSGEIKHQRQITDARTLGLEFSPNSSYLYISVFEEQHLYQVKVSNILNQTLETTEKVKLSTNGPILLILQLAPDGKIYGCSNGDSSLSTIEQPNMYGVNCKFKEQTVKFPTYYYFGVRRSRTHWSLPQFIQNLIMQPKLVTESGCAELKITYYVEHCFADSIRWYFSDSQSTVTTSDTVTHTFDKAGLYNVKAVLYYPNYSDTLEDTVRIYELQHPDLGNDTLLCNGEQFILKLPDYHDADLKWNDNDSSSSKTITVPGIYAVSISNNYCYQSDSIFVDFTNCSMTFDSLCLGNTTILKVNDPDIDSIIWDINSQTYKTDSGKVLKHVFDVPGTYLVSAEVYRNNLSLFLTKSIQITPLEYDFLPLTDTLCEPSFIKPDLANDHYTYDWSNGSVENQLFVQNPGVYSLKISVQGCSASDSILIVMEDCECGVYIPNSFSPNNDGINDVFSFITECDIDNVQLEIYTRWGEKVFDSGESNADYWDGIYQNSMSSSGVYLFLLRYTFENQHYYKKGTVNLLR